MIIQIFLKNFILISMHQQLAFGLEIPKKFKFKMPWDIKISNALYAALMTDTGSFRYNNTTSSVHDIHLSFEFWSKTL